MWPPFWFTGFPRSFLFERDIFYLPFFPEGAASPDPLFLPQIRWAVWFSSFGTLSGPPGPLFCHHRWCPRTFFTFFSSLQIGPFVADNMRLLTKFFFFFSSLSYSFLLTMFGLTFLCSHTWFLKFPHSPFSVVWKCATPRFRDPAALWPLP